MNPRALILSAALVIFTLQLVTLTPSFKPATYSVGEISNQESVRLALESEAQRLAAESAYHSIQFVGDVLLARNVEVLMLRHGSQYPYEGLSLQTLSHRPAIIANFESSMAVPHSMTPAFQVNFSVDKKHLPSFSQAGYTHVSLGNNHSGDFREEGFVHTIAQLESHNIKTFGQGKVINENSIVYIPSILGPVAIISINTSDQVIELETAEAVLASASLNSVMQVVYIHWGTEYDIHHNTTQRRLAEQFVENGADLIIGHHPHVVQDIEQINGVPVFYSLGNFIFDQYFSTDVQQGLVLALELKDPRPYVSLHPVSSLEKLSQPRAMQGKEREQFITRLAKRSDASLKEGIEQGKIELSWTVATSSKTAIMVE